MGGVWRQFVLSLCLAAIVSGCTRNLYRLRADAETMGILVEKTIHTPWAPPPNYNVYPDPRARFFNPTNPNDPALPIPAPKLYAYEIPDLPDRDPERFKGTVAGTLRAPSAALASGFDAADDIRSVYDSLADDTRSVPATFASNRQEEIPEPAPDSSPADLTSPDTVGADGELRVVPIPRDVWESLPPECLRRMFEFESVREEYARSFGREPSEGERDPSPRLALEDILELALVQSREYQAAKEDLYVAALNLTLSRYDYELKFLPTGNGTDVEFVHNRNDAQSVSTLGVGSEVGVTQVLATGGTFLASFANEVLLTFNGPDGFDADVSTQMLTSLSQSVFQRDVILEQLTQAEREVVYAAREFARFRKVFFRDLAAQYYNLLLAYRGIEIGAQDYFSNLRGFNQGEAEYRAGRLPRIQVDQFEQNALASRSTLIGRCNTLESGLDSLKLNIGIPPETPVNLDLTELESLTLRDEATVSAELVRRARRNLLQERALASPDRGTLVNAAINLTRRMLELSELRGRLGQEQENREALQLTLRQLLVEEAQLLAQFNRDILAEERRATPPAPPLRIFQRTIELVASLLTLAERQLNLAELRSEDAASIAATRQTLAELRQRLEAVRGELAAVVERRELERIPELVEQADRLLADADILATQTTPRQEPLDPAQQQQQTLEQIDGLLATGARMLGEAAEGLAPIEIDGDEAMLTALTQRFDLMNQRGALADFWRDIKFAGDDLRSVLNLNATQVVGTRNDDSSSDEFSRTELRLSFDAPLNRKEQRNAFRVSLINYNVAFRNLLELEDNIKFAVRDDLRDLQLDQEQYRIAVASAALAFERVGSTRLQLSLGVQDVAARDFLEAQQAYTDSLSDVASEHIGYIIDRIDLFLDLESLQVNQSGFWPDLYEEEKQPEPNLQPPCPYFPYGDLPSRTLPSRKIRRMLHVPWGQPKIFQTEGADEHGAQAEPEAIPTPPGEKE